MNIFILALCPKLCASYYFDKHVSKIIIEIAQMMSTAVRLLLDSKQYDPELIYTLTYVNHPVSLWLRGSQGNWQWTMDLVDALHEEWKYRYSHSALRTHASYKVILYIRNIITSTNFQFKEISMTPFAQAMPECYKNSDAIVAYRNFYKTDPHKVSLASWKKRGIPIWWNE